MNDLFQELQNTHAKLEVGRLKDNFKLQAFDDPFWFFFFFAMQQTLEPWHYNMAWRAKNFPSARSTLF